MSYAGIQRDIDFGRGEAANVLGQPYDVYRITATSNGDVIATANRIAQNVRVLRKARRVQPDAVESPAAMGTLFYQLVADFRNFQVGDVFVQMDAAYGSGHTEVAGTEQFNGFVLASHAPIKQAVGARVTTLVQVKRQSAEPDARQAWNTTNDATLPLVLANGSFSLGAATATASLIPAGMLPVFRPQGQRIDAPGMPQQPLIAFYMPPLPGFQLLEGDRIIAQDGSRYVVLNPYGQDVGIVGYQMTLEREMGA